MTAPTITERVQTGPLDVAIVGPAVDGRAVGATAAGYAWTVIADDDHTGAPRVRVTCHGRRASLIFERWQYPRADLFTAVGRAAVVTLTGARRADLEAITHTDGAGYVGRTPITDDMRPYGAEYTRMYAVTDLI